MYKHALAFLALSVLACSMTMAQTAPNTQTTQRLPSGNRTAGTTNNPVDPTSTNSTTITGTNPEGRSNGAVDAPTTTNTQTTQRTPVGNRTAGTTDTPTDPTSKTGVRKSGAGADLKGRKAKSTRKAGM